VDDRELGRLEGRYPLVDIEKLVEHAAAHDVEQLRVAGVSSGRTLEQGIIHTGAQRRGPHRGIVPG